MRRHARSGSTGVAAGNVKRPHNAKAAAQRLAQVLSNQKGGGGGGDDDEEEDDLLYDHNPATSSASIGLAGGRSAVARRRPAPVRTSVDQTKSGGRIVSSIEQQPPSSTHSTSAWPSPPNIVEQPLSALQPPSARHGSVGRSSPYYSTEQVECPSARSASALQSSQSTCSLEQPLVFITQRPQASVISADAPPDTRRDKRLSLDMGSMNFRESGVQRSTSALQDAVGPSLKLLHCVLLRPKIYSYLLGSLEVALLGSICYKKKMKVYSKSKQHVNKMSVVEMRMLKWMCSKTRKDRVRYEYIREWVGVVPIGDKLRENRLRWFGHIQRRPTEAVVKRCDTVTVDGSVKGNGRPRLTWTSVANLGEGASLEARLLSMRGSRT
ncbi:unnamed protein product [Camellia sinensis]